MIEKSSEHRAIRRNHTRLPQSAILKRNKNRDQRNGEQLSEGSFSDRLKHISGVTLMYYSELLARSLILYAEENTAFEKLFTLLVQAQVPRLQKLYENEESAKSVGIIRILLHMSRSFIVGTKPSLRVSLMNSRSVRCW